MRWCIHCKKSIEINTDFCPYCYKEQEELLDGQIENIQTDQTVFDFNIQKDIRTDQTVFDLVVQKDIGTDQTVFDLVVQKDIKTDQTVFDFDAANAKQINYVSVDTEQTLCDSKMSQIVLEARKQQMYNEYMMESVNAFGFSRVNSQETLYESLYDSSDILAQSQDEIKAAIPVSKETFLPIEQAVSIGDDTTLACDTEHGLIVSQEVLSRDEAVDEVLDSKMRADDETLDELEEDRLPQKDETLDEQELHTEKTSLQESESESFAYLRTIGAYRVIEEVGSGGMGRVYKVYNPKLRKILHLKLCIPQKVFQRQSIKGFSLKQD